MKKSTLGQGKFFKGNIHTHTSFSDGKIPAREVAGIYKELGYDFLAITDHNRVFKSDELNDLIYTIPALEIHSSKPGFHKTHHMVALTSYSNDKVANGQIIENAKWTEPAKSAAALSDMMSALGFDLVYCHAVWSRMDTDEYMDADFTAMEIYNGICELKYNQGTQLLHWDTLLRKGKRVWGVAADDCHGGEGHNGRGFIMVKAPNLDDENILEAIRSGSFYSSRGPKIHDFHTDGLSVNISCSPVKRITFISYENLGGSFMFENPVNGHSMNLHPDTKYVRAEIEDENGMKAWTNPIFL